MNNKKINNLIRTIIVIISYLIYTKLLFVLFKTININNSYNNWLFNFLADLIYLIFIVILYRRSLINNIKKLQKENLLIGIKWLVIAIILQLLTIAVIKQFVEGIIANEAAIKTLPFGYLIFKTMIFSVIVEEIVFKKSIRDVISNNFLFIIISSLFYGLMNIVYADLGLTLDLLVILPYFIVAIIMGILYIKTDNIVLLMIIKFIYNIIPLMATVFNWIK